MPLATATQEVVEETEQRQEQTQPAPTDDNRETSTEDDKSLDTRSGLPPYLHYEDINRNSLILFVASLAGVLWLLSEKLDLGVSV